MDQVLELEKFISKKQQRSRRLASSQNIVQIINSWLSKPENNLSLQELVASMPDLVDHKEWALDQVVRAWLNKNNGDISFKQLSEEVLPLFEDRRCKVHVMRTWLEHYYRYKVKSPTDNPNILRFINALTTLLLTEPEREEEIIKILFTVGDQNLRFALLWGWAYSVQREDEDIWKLYEKVWGKVEIIPQLFRQSGFTDLVKAELFNVLVEQALLAKKLNLAKACVLANEFIVNLKDAAAVGEVINDFKFHKEDEEVMIFDNAANIANCSLWLSRRSPSLHEALSFPLEEALPPKSLLNLKEVLGHEVVERVNVADLCSYYIIGIDVEYLKPKLTPQALARIKSAFKPPADKVVFDYLETKLLRGFAIELPTFGILVNYFTAKLQSAIATSHQGVESYWINFPASDSRWPLTSQAELNTKFKGLISKLINNTATKKEVCAFIDELLQIKIARSDLQEKLLSFFNTHLDQILYLFKQPDGVNCFALYRRRVL
jgi:hypothetical protein